MKRYFLVLLLVCPIAISAFADLLNDPGFESNQYSEATAWTSSLWKAYGPGMEVMGHSSWAARTGVVGAYIPGWITNVFEGGIYQDVTTSVTGEYSFSIWAKRQINFDAHSAQLRLTFCDIHTNTLAGSSNAEWRILPPLSQWYPAYVSGRCGDTNLAFIRVAVYSMWTNTGGSLGEQGLQLDDAALYAGSYTGAVFSVPTAMTNTDFEHPTATILWDESGWMGGNNDSMQRPSWAAISGLKGGAINAWSTNNGSHAAIYQWLQATATSYTFTLWYRNQGNAHPTNLRMRLEWYDHMSQPIQVDERNYTSLTRDPWWHRLYVTGVCADPGRLYVRPTLLVDWTDQYDAGNGGMVFDLAEFYSGIFTSRQAVADAGFEEENVPDPLIRRWIGVAEEIMHVRNWGGPPEGSKYAVMEGFWTNSPYLEATLSQSLNVDPGTYLLSLYVMRGVRMLTTNVQIKIEWFDDSLTNKLAADTIATLTPPADDVWHAYAITGTCLDARLFEVRPSVKAQWNLNLTNNDGRILGIDGVSFAVHGANGNIPAAWWQTYNLATNTSAYGNSDWDYWSNLEEYIADTNPTNSTSGFEGVSRVAGTGVSGLQIDGTSTSRVYDVFWKTNLLDASDWQAYGLSVTGNHSTLTLSVTNIPGRNFYRTGVRLP